MNPEVSKTHEVGAELRRVESFSDAIGRNADGALAATPEKTMEEYKKEPSRSMRLLGAIVALALFAAFLVTLMLVLEAGEVNQRTIESIGKAFTYSGVGVMFLGWNWPNAIFHPFKVLLSPSLRIKSIRSLASNGGGILSKLLPVAAQRLLFVVSCIGLLPWMFIRLIGETWRSHGARDYFFNVFVKPLDPWFDVFYSGGYWYDWPVYPCFFGLLVAFTWPLAGARIWAWIRNSK